MMRALLLAVAFHTGAWSVDSGMSKGRIAERARAPEAVRMAPPPSDRWLAPDKAKHFFMAAFIQSVSFGALRAVGASRRSGLAGATAVTAAVSIGKELYDRTSGGDPSWKDLAWDAAGLLVASAMLHQTKP